MALFQHIYPPGHRLLWSLPAMPEWYGVIALFMVLSALGVAWSPLLVFAPMLGAMILFAVAQATVHALRARLPADAGGLGRRVRMRVLIGALYQLQPLSRCVGRTHYGLTPWRLRGVRGFAWPLSCRVECWHHTWRDHFARLADLEDALRQGGAVVVRGGECDQWDLELRGGLVGRVRIRQFAADLPHRAQYIRVEGSPRCAGAAALLFLLLATICAGAAAQERYALAGAAWLGAAILAALAVREIGAAMATFKRAVARLGEC
jgi:hypothetical protein